MTKGWTAERRAAQAARMRARKPWERSTGPRTEAGKARSRGNAVGKGCLQRLDAELAEVEALMREWEVARGRLWQAARLQPVSQRPERQPQGATARPSQHPAL
jgi:hypothetical protein